ncbi:MAG: prolipoprotein diacylglyceryl transferase [Mycoplasmataceae bacterium]|nr:prolipoprotein diacylglyceryl transferase [Mycoplasmataceae bacterium]
MNFLFEPIPPDNIWNETTSPIAFSIGEFAVRWYSLFIFIGFFFAILLTIIKLWKFYKVPVDPFYWYCMMGIPTSILGGRIWSCMIGDAKWYEFFNFATGGMAIEGAVILTVILGLCWFPYILRKPKYQVRDIFSEPVAVRQVSTWVYADAIVPTILIGQIIGRWGNYFNQELYGPIVTNEAFANWLKIHLPYMYVQNDGNYHQPLFLWEGLLNAGGLLLLYIGAEFVPNKKSGDLAISYFLWYGIVRLCLEPLRASSYTFWLTYLMSSLWVAVALILLLFNHLLIWKIRKYHLFLLIKTYIIYFSIKWWQSLKLKIFRHTKSQKTEEIRKIININDQKYQNQKQHFIRSHQQMLYYLGR